MRIVTRADFDGIVSAVLLYDVLDITGGIAWVEPGDLQKNRVDIQKDDVIANLPFHKNCALWFDHHYSNRIEVPYEGLYRVAPSAAGLIYEYYKNSFSQDFSEMVFQADKIDAADLSPEEVQYPENHPYLLLSMTINGNEKEQASYWNRLVELLGNKPVDKVLENPEVKKRCRETIRENQAYGSFLKEYTYLTKHVSVTDFRPLTNVPNGNRFLVYSLFPECVVNVKIRFAQDDRNRILLSIGHSIFNRNCHVNVGALLSRFEGGGHRGAGACSFSADKADTYIPQILDILLKNKELEEGR